LVTY